VPADRLKVAVTGPTGDLGIALVSALERSRRVGEIVGMARRPFDPADAGWKRTTYVQGDIRDSSSLKAAFKGADVVVHLAFSILGSGEETREINVDGSRRVFEAAIAAGASRICYASSVAAYGFHEDNPDWLDEEVPPRGTPQHYYSQQKAELEDLLERLLKRRRKTVAYVFRPCIVAGPTATTLVTQIPYVQLSERMPEAVVRLLSMMPALKPVVPDTGLPFQLVHEDDVASAFVAAVAGKGSPGAYNLAAPGTITVTHLANALGWYSIPFPQLAVDAAAEVLARLPSVPELAGWIEALRKPVLMKTAKAKKELGWRPKHNAAQTLGEMVQGWRAEQPVG
jgi:UDP-glucose 4-epimerase